MKAEAPSFVLSEVGRGSRLSAKSQFIRPWLRDLKVSFLPSSNLETEKLCGEYASRDTSLECPGMVGVS